MPRLLLPRVIQDPGVRFGPDDPQDPLAGIVERVAVHAQAFGDGPACERVVVVDRGAPGIPVPMGADGPTLADPTKLYNLDCVAVSAFATVLRVLNLVERKDVLGQPLRFPFPGRLRLEPGVGDWDNAAYERASGSLRFGWHVPPGGARRRWYALSHDAVAHETGHLVVDALAPDLHDSTHPQSLAVHEALADLLAFVSAMQSPALLQHELSRPAGSLDEFDVLGTIAESSAAPSVEQAGPPRYIRRLQNVRRLVADPPIDRIDPHALAEVMGGLLYDLYNPALRMVQRPLDPLFHVGDQPDGDEPLQDLSRPYLQRVIGALAVLPPGECSFLDLARTIVAWAAAAGDAQAAQVERALHDRGLLAAGQVLSRWSGPFDEPGLVGIDLDGALTDPAGLVPTIRQHQKLFGVEAGTRVRLQVSTASLPDRSDEQDPGLDRSGDTPLRPGATGSAPRRLLVVKCGWDRIEANPLGDGFPATRRVRVGSTVAFDRDQPGRVLLSILPRDADPQDQADRDLLLRRWIDRGLLLPPGTPGAALHTQADDGHLRISGAARALHLHLGRGAAPPHAVPRDPTR